MKAAAATPPLSHRERLLSEGLRHFYASGFHGTSVDELLAAAGAPKGSFYHHFGSKEAFAKAVLGEYSAQQSRSLAEFVARDDLSAYRKLLAYFDALVDRFAQSEHKVACLAGKFSTELAPNSDEFSGAIAASMKNWRLAVTRLLAAGHRDGSIRRDMTPTQQGFLLQALVQGSLVVSLADRSAESLSAIRAMLPKLLSAKHGPQPKAAR